jgi:hypothetical protein
LTVAFSRQPRYERAASEFLAKYAAGLEEVDEQRFILLWDSFVLEHKLVNGRTVVEQFVAADPQLSDAEREMLLGWQDVVQGPFEVFRRVGPALVVQGRVDKLTYRVRSTMGPRIFRRTPPGRSSSADSSRSVTSGWCPARSIWYVRPSGTSRTGWRSTWRCGCRRQHSGIRRSRRRLGNTSAPNGVGGTAARRGGVRHGGSDL